MSNTQLLASVIYIPDMPVEDSRLVNEPAGPHQFQLDEMPISCTLATTGTPCCTSQVIYLVVAYAYLIAILSP